MITKLFEVRDRNTFICVIAIKFVARDEAERYLLGRTGFGVDAATQAGYLFVANIADHRSGSYDAFGHCSKEFENRTLRDAHLHLNKNFDNMPSGSVIDVQFINGETAEPKVSERLTDVEFYR